MKLIENKILSITALVLFSGAVFLIGLGRMPLTDPDEVFYAETAKEMLKRGELLTPYIFGNPQFEKPPLYYWLVIFSFRVFGVNEFAARLPSAIFGILGVIAIYLLGSLTFTKKTGFFSAVILATGLKYIVLARGCVTDIVLAVSILGAFLFFFYGYTYEYGKTKWYLLSSLCLSLSVLTKGPIFLFLPVLIIGLYLIFTKEFKKLKEIPFFSGSLIFLLVSLPWYFLMYKIHGDKFIDVFFGFHNIIRFLEPEHKIGDVFYYYIPVVTAGLFPWVVFLPLGIWQAFRGKETRAKKFNLFILIWFLVIFVFFSISRTKLPTYVFPLYPSLALLIGRLFDQFTSGEFTDRMEKWMKISLYAFPVFIGGAVISFYIVAKIKYASAANPFLASAGVFTILMAIFMISFLRKMYVKAFLIFTVSFIVFAFLLSYTALPRIGEYESSKEISAKLKELVKPGDKVGSETKYRRGIAFYMDRVDIIDVHPHHVITKLLEKEQRAWCILKEKNHIELYTDKKKPYGKPTYVVYQSDKRVIITNKIPEDGKFLRERTKNVPW